MIELGTGIRIARDQVHEPLFAVVPVFNPWRHKSRIKHTERALKHFHDSGAVIILVEAGFNRRDLVFADFGLDGTLAQCKIHGEYRHKYVPLHTKDELWLKECLGNIGAQHAPYNWQNMCMLDSDVHFVRPNWVGECIQKLQHYSFLQMFSQAQDLGPNYEMLPEGYTHSSGMSFVQAWQTGVLETIVTPGGTVSASRLSTANERATGNHCGPKKCKCVNCPPHKKCRCHCHEDPYPYPPNVWPGLAWAWTRQAFDAVGGLFDVAIWGGGDYDMAHALIEQAVSRIHSGVHPNYRTLLAEWEQRCKIHIRRNVGLMEGTLFHNWHGKKADRKYTEKRKLMRKVAFDPLKHLKKDFQGLWQLHDDGSENFVHFRDMMRKISAERKEDSIDI